MNTPKAYQGQQEAQRLDNRIVWFMIDFKTGTMLNTSGIRKLRGVLSLKLFGVMFMMPFEGDFFSRECKDCKDVL